MKPQVYITIPENPAFLQGLCSVIGNSNFASLTTSDYVFELTINDSISSARITKYISTRIYPNDNNYRFVSNDEFMVLVILAKKSKLFNEI